MSLKLVACAASVLALAACDGAGPGGMADVNVAIASEVNAEATGMGFVPAVQTDSEGNTLIIDSVFVVVRKMKLLGGSAPCEGVPVEAEDCGVIWQGPTLVSLPIGSSGAEHMFTASVPTGSYTRVQFQIHKPSGDADFQFLEDHPEYDGVSVRVVGSWNANAFVYTTGVTDVQGVTFSPPLEVNEPSANFTLLVDLSGWFWTPGGALIDPATAMGDGANAVLVHQNVIRSFRAFADEDEDGADDLAAQ